MYDQEHLQTLIKLKEDHEQTTFSKEAFGIPERTPKEPVHRVVDRGFKKELDNSRYAKSSIERRTRR